MSICARVGVTDRDSHGPASFSSSPRTGGPRGGCIVRADKPTTSSSPPPPMPWVGLPNTRFFFRDACWYYTDMFGKVTYMCTFRRPLTTA